MTSQPSSEHELASPASLAAKVQEGIAHHQQGRWDEARKIYQEVLARDPAQFDALHLQGVLALQAGDPLEAARLIGLALERNQRQPQHADALVNRGAAFKALKQFEDALACYDAALALHPIHVQAHFNRGNVLRDMGNQADAVKAFNSVLAHNANHGEAWFNLGLCLSDLGQTAGAAAAFEKALANGMNARDVHLNLGPALRKLGRLEDAVNSFSALIAASPDDATAYNNRGVILADLGRKAEALSDYAKAIALKADFAGPYINRGIALRVAEDHEGAADDFARAAERDPRSAKAFYNLGTTLSVLKRYAPANAAFAAVAELDPNYPFLLGSWLHGRMMLCDWKDYDTDVAALKRMVHEGQQATPPLPLCAVTDDLDLHQKAAATWGLSQCPADSALGALPARARTGKIRIGYFSADFRLHPVSQLAIGMFESHDRTRFETTAFSFGPDTGDSMRQRLEKAFDRFIEVRAKTDRKIAQLARGMDLDIAVDLTGYTGGARMGIFALRAAPVQVGYLGYPATLGLSYIDYLIADPIMVPPVARPFYGEQIAYIPSFQVNDRKRDAPEQTFSREALGLPPRGFVFACFNNPYKITPDAYDSWMRILRAVPDSVLVIQAEGLAAENLKAEAQNRGVDPARLVILNKVPMPEYWARLRAADLFLDTFYLNAHSTASDALWAGLPVLTLPGQTAVARVGASLLSVLGLPELITENQADYEKRAIDLAHGPDRLTAIKRDLLRRRLTTPLFDTERYTRAIERVFAEMATRARDGLPPEDIAARDT